MLFNCVLVFMIMAETQLNPAEAKGGIYCNWAVKQTRGKGELGSGKTGYTAQTPPGRSFCPLFLPCYCWRIHFFGWYQLVQVARQRAAHS